LSTLCYFGEINRVSKFPGVFHRQQEAEETSDPEEFKPNSEVWGPIFCAIVARHGNAPLRVAIAAWHIVDGKFSRGSGEQVRPSHHATGRWQITTGEQFNNESVKGKVVLFEFWTTWCKYCEEEASLVDSIAQEFKSKDLIVLAVDVLEPDQRVKKYLVEHPRSVPIVLTKDTNLAAMYNAQVYPIYVLVDRDGKIAAEQRGSAGERGLRRMLRRAGLESE
jgi:thiol-disulfide isomerase/thioredoxin